MATRRDRKIRMFLLLNRTISMIKSLEKNPAINGNPIKLIFAIIKEVTEIGCIQ